MTLDNTLILRGSYYEIKDIKEEITNLIKNPSTSKLYDKNIFKAIKKLVIEEEMEVNGLYNLTIKFKYKKPNIKDFLNLFSHFAVEVIHMCEDVKNEIWIVNNYEYVALYRLIPAFAVNKILLDYMEYMDSAIILDNYETIKYDLNNKRISIDNKRLSHGELLTLLFEKTIKGKYFYYIIESFVKNYHQKCINSYEDLYSINKEGSSTEDTTTPLALFIVTFGLFTLILVLLKIMGYI